MAVKEKNETGDEPAEAVDIEWNNAENELQLLQILCGTRPVGISKYFQMACVVEKLTANMNREVTAKSIWEHLGTMYDLKKMDEHETLPFPNEETDFVLSTEDFGELMENKFKEAEVKKTIKKEKEEVKKEKMAPETPQPEKKAPVKRTRASTAPSTTTAQVTPKRRRL